MLKMLKRRSLLIAALAASVALPLSSGLAQAQADNWPSRPVTIVVPFGPGAITDQSARLLAQLLQEKYKQPFVVENRPGAGSLVGARAVSESKPDGYTLMVTAWTIATLKLGTPEAFNPLETLTPITRIVHNPVAMLVPTSSGVNTLAEFKDYVDANPDKAFYGITSVGTAGHIRYEQFNLATGLKMKPIVYQSGSEIITDTSQARLAACFLSVSSAMSMVNAGLLKVIGYVGEGVGENVPQGPNLMNDGLDFEWASWTGLFAAPGMDAGLLDTIYSAVNEVTHQPKYLEFLDNAGALPEELTPDQFVEKIAQERKEIAEVLEKTGIDPK